MADQGTTGNAHVQDPKQIMRACVDAFNRGDLDGLNRLFAPDAEVCTVLGSGTLEQAQELWTDWMHSLGARFEIEDMVAEGDTVVARIRERGSSVREFRGYPPTGKSYEILAVEWLQVKNGLIVRRWGIRDAGDMLRQLGF